MIGKQRIAELVEELVQDGDSLMLDASSTAVYIAKTLKEKERKNLTIITNSIEIIIELFDAPEWRVLSTGGVSREGTFALVGPQTDKMLRAYHVDKTIISCKGSIFIPGSRILMNCMQITRRRCWNLQRKNPCSGQQQILIEQHLQRLALWRKLQLSLRMKNRR